MTREAASGIAHNGDSRMLRFFLALATLASAAYLSVLIFSGTHLAEAFRRRRALSAGAPSAVGAVFVGFAVKLALASA